MAGSLVRHSGADLVCDLEVDILERKVSQRAILLAAAQLGVDIKKDGN